MVRTKLILGIGMVKNVKVATQIAIVMLIINVQDVSIKTMSRFNLEIVEIIFVLNVQGDRNIHLAQQIRAWEITIICT